MANGNKSKSNANKRSLNFAKKVKQVVREELQEELENKVAVIGLDNESIDTSAIPSGIVSSASNFIQLLPSIGQGTGQYNERIGNEIRLRSLDIKMLLQYKRMVEDDPLAVEDSNVGVRVMILRQKENNDFVQFYNQANTDNLLENGAITTPGPAPFSGDTFNLFQKINREQFSVRYDKTFYMDRHQATGSGATIFYQKTPRPTFVSHRLTFGKQGLKLTYGEATDTTPTNFPYLMVIGIASTSGAGVPSDNLINYSYTANANYTDA